MCWILCLGVIDWDVTGQDIKKSTRKELGSITNDWLNYINFLKIISRMFLLNNSPYLQMFSFKATWWLKGWQSWFSVLCTKIFFVHCRFLLLHLYANKQNNHIFLAAKACQFQTRKSLSPTQHDYIKYRIMYIMHAQNCSRFTFMLSVPNSIWIY